MELGATLKEHSADGSITVHVLQGLAFVRRNRIANWSQGSSWHWGHQLNMRSSPQANPHSC